MRPEPKRPSRPRGVAEEALVLSSQRALLSAGSEAIDVKDDGKRSFRWRNYEDWMNRSWQVRVLARAADQGRSQPSSPSRTGMRSLNVNSFRMF